MRRFGSAVTVVFVLLLTFLPAGGLPAQAVVGDIRFSPPAFYVGDRVTMTIQLSLADTLEIGAPSDLPESDWAEIISVTADSEGRNATVVIEFISFAPGTRALPEIDLGELTIRDLKVPTRSVLSDERQEVRSLRGQLLLPGTRLALALLLVLAAMAPFLGFGLVRSLWKQLKLIREAWKVGRPARKLRRTVRALRISIGQQGSVSWFSQLTEALRRYMSSKTGHDCTSATTAEIAEMSEFSVDDTAPARLLAVLYEGDMVKFAGRFADDRSLGRTLDQVEKAVQGWEKMNDQLQ